LYSEKKLQELGFAEGNNEGNAALPFQGG